MESTPADSWQSVLAMTYEQIVQQLILFTPKLLGAILLLVVGWLVALLLAKLARAGLNVLNRMLSRVFSHVIPKSDLEGGATHINFVARAVFWLVLLFFVAVAVNNLGLDIVSIWMSEVFLYLPQLVAASVIIIGGYLLSRAVKLMAVSTARSVGFTQAELLGRSVQVAVLFTALVIGIEQLGIDLHFLTQFLIVMAAVLTAGFSLAFALGASHLVANIIGVQQIRNLCEIGDEIAMKDAQGMLIEINSTTLVLESPQGRTTVPARLFLEQIGHIKSPTDRIK